MRPLYSCAFISAAFMAFAIVGSGLSLSAAKPASGPFIQLSNSFEEWVDQNSILGAQVIIGSPDNILFEQNFGVRSAKDSTAVNSKTQFCIGSCSKPIASALIMTLLQDGVFDLDQEIDAYLSEFGNLKTSKGKPARAPTMRELLCHQGGIYSQKKGMTRRQSRWIRDFKLELDEAVVGIAGERLIAEPGGTYAYSGAGYCVVGRVAEVVAESSIEDMLQQRICKPLGLQRTSYFPDPSDPNLASGSLRGRPNPTTPHFSEPFQLPLIGGSIYSTAGDSARFLQMILHEGKVNEESLLAPEIFETYTSPHANNGRYALGWSLIRSNGKLIGLTHSGSLASSRALFRVNWNSDLFAAVIYTVSNPAQSRDLGRMVSQVISQATNSRLP